MTEVVAATPSGVATPGLIEKHNPLPKVVVASSKEQCPAFFCTSNVVY